MWYSFSHTRAITDINQGVDKLGPRSGAGDQGIMFGYATNETPSYTNWLEVSHNIPKELAILRRENNKTNI